MADNGCKLFVRNLSYRTTDKDLKEYYGQWGKVEECSVMKDKGSGKSKGFGFVRYFKPSMVDEAMSNRPHELDDKKLEPHRAAPKEYSAKPESHYTCNDIFVGGVRAGLSDDEIREYFSNYGTIVKINIPKVKDDPKKVRGFAVVSFDDYDPVDICCHKKWHQINTWRLDVTKYIDKKDMEELVRKYGNGIDDGWGRPPKKEFGNKFQRGGGNGNFSNNNRRGGFGQQNDRGGRFNNNRSERGGFQNNRGGGNRGRPSYDQNINDDLLGALDDYNPSDLLDRAILTQRALLARSIADLDYESRDRQGPVKGQSSYGRQRQESSPYPKSNRTGLWM